MIYKKILLAGLLSVTSNVSFADTEIIKHDRFEECREQALALRPGLIIKVEMKIEDDAEVYEFNIRDIENRDWDIECAAATGQIIEIEEEVYGINDPRFSEQMKIDYARAKEIALQFYPGEILEVEYEIEESGLAVYEFDIWQATDEVIKLEVNSRTGEIHEFSRELWQIGYE
ncbi:MAG: PepSY domain-containing protein [Gammaproteobacteria bacterium]